MVIIGARDPLAMGDDNYGRLCLELKFFLADSTSLPNRPTHMVASQIAKADAFVAAIDVMNNAQNVMREATKFVEDAYKLLDEKLRWMRNILPTLTPGDDSILIPFGLDKPVPNTYEKLKNYADAADAHWQTVALEPLFAPYAAGCNELAGLIADFEAKRMIQVSLSSAYSAAQNDKDLARADHHTVERAIFEHYSAYYTDAQDLYWDETPWGRATSQEPPVPIPDWPGPGTFSGSYVGEKQVELIYGPVKDATHCDIEVKPHNESEWVVLFNDLTMDPANITKLRQLNVPEGKYDYRLVPYNGEDKGDIAEITVEVKY